MQNKNASNDVRDELLRRLFLQRDFDFSRVMLTLLDKLTS